MLARLAAIAQRFVVVVDFTCIWAGVWFLSHQAALSWPAAVLRRILTAAALALFGNICARTCQIFLIVIRHVFHPLIK